MGIPDHLTCLLRNLYEGQEVTVRTRHGTTDWFKIGRGVCQSHIWSPCLFNIYIEHIMRNARQNKLWAGIKIAGRNITSDMQMIALQYSCLENPWMEEPGRLQSMGSRRVGHDWATSLSLFTFMHWRRKWQPTPVLAWRIPGTGEPGGLPSMGSHRVGHDWSNLAAAAAAL